MTKKIHLLLVDPQNSFCNKVPEDQQQVLHDGELCVPGAWEDMCRISDLINTMVAEIVDISATLDTHPYMHIAHTEWYQDSKGNKPEPFTFMRAENGLIMGNKNGLDVGPYVCLTPLATDNTINYLMAVEALGKTHCLWPPHCLLGAPGHNVVAPLMDAFINWTRSNGIIDFLFKGLNPWVEQLSAVCKEVPDPKNPIDVKFIKNFEPADEILAAGEASSHCLSRTLEDMGNYVGDEFYQKLVFLTDGSSPVPGFESNQDEFIARAVARGMRTTTIADYLA